MAIAWNAPTSTPASSGSGISWNSSSSSPAAPATPAAKPDSFASMALGLAKSAIAPVLDTLSPAGPFTSSIVSNAPKIASDLVNAPSEIASTAEEGVNQGANALKAVNAGTLDPVEGALDVGSGVAQALFSPTAPLIAAGLDGSGASEAMNDIEQGISDIPQVQKFATSPEGGAAIRAAQDVSDAANIAGSVAGGPKATEAATATPDSFASLAQTAKAKVISTPDQQLANVAADWAKPGNVNAPGFADARAILANSPETPEFLSQQGLNPYEHIVDGKYDTEDAANAFRDTPGKMSSDMLRPSLQMADYMTPKTPVSDISNAAIREVQNDTDTTPGDEQTAISHITNEANALEAKFPEGMSLTDMHDNKITYAKNSGYSPIKDPATNIKATANRSVATALQRAVETKAPENLPVAKFNAYLSKYYKAADYLDAINTKKAPVSLGTQIARGVAKFGGAALGGKFGGGIVSEFAGYQIGKALEHAAENLTNPMRASFLRNLQITNPQAYERVAQFLGQQEAERATRLALPSGKPLGTPENPILMGPGADKSGVRTVPAQKPTYLQLPAARAIIPAPPSVESEMASRAAAVRKASAPK